MKKVIESDEFVVYDDVLESQAFNVVRNAAEADDFSIPHLEKWLKVWRISDGIPMGGKSYAFKKNEDENLPDNFMTYMYRHFKELANKNPVVCGEWNEVVLRCYLYGRETKLSWHNDKGYIAAGIFYCHNYWASTWGGELMIAKTPIIESVPNPCMNHIFEDKFLEYYGFGQYITCKPNRLVLTKGGVWHSINRVDKDAGDHIRMSIVAFFNK